MITLLIFIVSTTILILGFRKKTISSDEIAELILHLRKYAVMHLESSTDLTLRINRIKAKERLKYERMLECKNTK